MVPCQKGWKHTCNTVFQYQNAFAANFQDKKYLQHLLCNPADIKRDSEPVMNFTVDTCSLQNSQWYCCHACFLSWYLKPTFKASMTRSLASNSPSRMLNSVSSSGLLSFSRFILKTWKITKPSLAGISLDIEISVPSYDIQSPFNFSFQLSGVQIALRGDNFLPSLQHQLQKMHLSPPPRGQEHMHSQMAMAECVGCQDRTIFTRQQPKLPGEGKSTDI